MNYLRNVFDRLVMMSLEGISVERLRREDDGQTLVEYGLIVALIAIVAVGALTFLHGKITAVFSQVGSSL